MASITIDRRDGLNSAAAIKGPCRVATTANITLSGLQTVDGVALAEGDRVLCKDQTDARDNGIRIVSTGNWERSADFRNNRDLVTGTQIYVTSGSVSGNRWYGLTAANPISVGTTNLTFALSDNLEALGTATDAAIAAVEDSGAALVAQAEAAADRAEDAATSVIERAYYPTVQSLMADDNTVISYSTGALFQVASGDRISAGPFEYVVVASDAGSTNPVEDAHAWHVQTAGGVKLKQLIGATIGYVAEAFGAHPDNADNYSYLQRLLDTGAHCLIGEGDFKCSQELEIIRPGQRIVGAGRGFGFSANTEEFVDGAMVPKWSSPVFNWSHVTTIRFIGTGDARVRTRVDFRGSAVDPEDSPMSVNVNIQADGVQLQNLCVFLDITPPAGGPADELNDSIDNLGADWDVGIFIGSRLNVHLTDVAVIGYHRMANIWGDATQCEQTPRFDSARGFTYPQGVAESGGDGTLLRGVYTSGGLWGVNVQSAKPKAGESDYTDDYYDELLGTTVADTRGLWGWSDFAIEDSQIFGANHHTRRRLVDMKVSPNAETDWDVGGAFSIDGLAVNANKAVHGHRYFNTRFQSWAPFCVRIDRSSRDTFIGCMIESPQPWVKTRTGGEIGEATTATSFGGLCATDNHSFLFILESQVPYYTTYTTLKYGDVVLANSSLGNRYSKIAYSELRIQADVASTTSRIFMGYDGNPTAVTLSRSSANSFVVTTSGQVVFQNASATALGTITSLGSFISGAGIYPTNDNTNANGLPSNRWTTIYAASSTINTSDGRLKTLRDGIEIDAENWRVSPFTPAEIAAAVDLGQEIGVFKFKDAVEEKGEDARLHVGMTVQRAINIMESHGLFPFLYSFICYDEWEAEDAVYETVGDEENGYQTVLVSPAREAGNVYSFRESGLYAFILKGMASRQNRLDARLAALETK